jgi:hypothetical protein
MNNLIICIEKIIYKYYIMFCIYSSLCKKNFIQNQYIKKSSNTYTQQYVKGVLSYMVKPDSIKKEYMTIENIVYDNDGDFGQFVSIDYE